VEYGKTVILYLGKEKVNKRTAVELQTAYPAIFIANDEQALKELLLKHIGPACA
jgi:hypothetical protein